MTTHDVESGNDPGTTPVLFLVDADPSALDAAATALSRRFGADYQVRSAGSAEEAIEALEQLASHGNDLALIAADLPLPAGGGIEFLRRAHALHPRGFRTVWLDGRRFAGHEDSAHSGADMTVRTVVVQPNGEISDEQELDDRCCECFATAAVSTSCGVLVAYRDRSADEVRDIALARHEGGRWTKPYLFNQC